MSMEAWSQQLPHLHCSWLILISGCGCFSARGRCRTVLCRRALWRAHPADRYAAHVRSQLRPSRVQRSILAITHHYIGAGIRSNPTTFSFTHNDTVMTVNKDIKDSETRLTHLLNLVVERMCSWTKSLPA